MDGFFFQRFFIKNIVVEQIVFDRNDIFQMREHGIFFNPKKQLFLWEPNESLENPWESFKNPSSILTSHWEL